VIFTGYRENSDTRDLRRELIRKPIQALAPPMVAAVLYGCAPPEKRNYTELGDIRESLNCDGCCLRRPAKIAWRRLSADNPDEVPKHINALSMGIMNCMKAAAQARSPHLLFTCKIKIGTPATKQ
jgi:hypothetical protein